MLMDGRRGGGEERKGIRFPHLMSRLPPILRCQFPKHWHNQLLYMDTRKSVTPYSLTIGWLMCRLKMLFLPKTGTRSVGTTSVKMVRHGLVLISQALLPVPLPRVQVAQVGWCGVLPPTITPVQPKLNVPLEVGKCSRHIPRLELSIVDSSPPLLLPRRQVITR